MTASENSSSQQPAPPDEPKKHNFWAKVGIASAVGGIGSKLGLIGTFFDVNNLFKGQEVSLGHKIKTIFSPKIGELFVNPIIKDVEALQASGKVNRAKMLWVTSVKPVKWTTLVATAGMVVGGVVGWMRAGLLQDSKDVLHHPITSLKIVLGLEKPKGQNPSEL